MKIPQNKQYVLFGGVFVLANKMQAVADKSMRGLSTKQWFLLRNLSDMCDENPPTITALAKETDTSRQNVSKMLAVLERQGYVDLQGSKSDHRSQRVSLTPQGAQKLRLVAQEAQPFFSELFECMSEEEINAGANAVLKMIAKLNKMQEGQQ